jgi:thioredoxin reductase (NADPH)
VGATQFEAVIVGGGLAGLSAAIYLGRARRHILVIDEKRSMARWEPHVQNYLGFPSGIAGDELVRRGRKQARRYGVRFVKDRIVRAKEKKGGFRLQGDKRSYECKRLLISTGIFHIPPDLPQIDSCLGHSMFFCKDCDGYRVQGQAIGIYGWTNEAVEYALAMLVYSPCVVVLSDGRSPAWDKQHQRWLREYRVPVHTANINAVEAPNRRLRSLSLHDGTDIVLDALFITRGDVYYNDIARGLGAKVDVKGEVRVDADMRTTVKGLYAAGCVTPANCQMIIAAGQGATAAQAINRDLFQESLASHNLRRLRGKQLGARLTRPHTRRPMPTRK